MNQQEINAKVKEVMAAPSCYEGLKQVCQAYLDAVGTPGQKEAAHTLVDALHECVGSIDGALAFFQSEHGAEVLGKENAASMTAAAKAAKAKGVKYCICPACTAGGVLLDHAEDL
jgi:hypothetical protein